jgi:histone H3/H4
MAKKATKKKAAKKKSTSMEQLIVGSKVKAAIRENGCMTSGELLEALNAEVHTLLENACARATNNKRSTVRAHDI